MTAEEKIQKVLQRIKDEITLCASDVKLSIKIKNHDDEPKILKKLEQAGVIGKINKKSNYMFEYWEFFVPSIEKLNTYQDQLVTKQNDLVIFNEKDFYFTYDGDGWLKINNEKFRQLQKNKLPRKMFDACFKIKALKVPIPLNTSIGTESEEWRNIRKQDENDLKLSINKSFRSKLMKDIQQYAKNKKIILPQGFLDNLLHWEGGNLYLCKKYSESITK